MTVSAISRGGPPGLFGRASFGSPPGAGGNFDQIRKQLEGRGGADSLASGAAAGQGLGKAQQALAQLSKNFDSIDQDGDGALSKNELKSFASQKGINISEDKLSRLTSGSGLTQDKLEALQERIGQAREAKRARAGFPGAEALASKGKGLSPDVLQNLSGDSAADATQKTDGSQELFLLETLLQEQEENDDKNSAPGADEENEVNNFAKAKLRVYEGSSDEDLRSELSNTIA